MKIALLTLGSRGDVQPYAVLGQALTLRGHSITLSTAKNFESLVKSYGIAFKPIEVDYQEILKSEEGKKLLKANPFVIKRNLNKWIYPLVVQSLNEFYQLSLENDKVIYHPKTLADVFADQMPEKMIRAAVVPAMQPTTEFANPAFSGFPIPSFLNKLSYKLTDLSMKMLNKPIRQFRLQKRLSIKYNLIETPFIYGISPAFLSKPKDYPKNQYFTGFWYAKNMYPLDEDIKRFIETGEPPIVITFGSMPFKSKVEITELVKELVEKFKTRIIVIKGWGITDLKAYPNDKSMLFVDSVPYDALFPRVRAVVHHGGIGTTAECLRAGKPMFICPILYPVGDQKFWGDLAFQKGVAVKPLPVNKLTKDNFLNSVKQLLNNQSLYKNSIKLAEEINKEDGITQSVKIIENNVC
jgi:sterol 3beta-glucosyltransferase